MTSPGYREPADDTVDHGGTMRGLVIYAYAVALAPLILGPLLIRNRYHGRHRR